MYRSNKSTKFHIFKYLVIVTIYLPIIFEVIINKAWVGLCMSWGCIVHKHTLMMYKAPGSTLWHIEEICQNFHIMNSPLTTDMTWGSKTSL